jgi:hypothetical protein
MEFSGYRLPANIGAFVVPIPNKKCVNFYLELEQALFFNFIFKSFSCVLQRMGLDITVRSTRKPQFMSGVRKAAA